MPESRRLGDAEMCILLVYTLPETAMERGYEPWLRSTDNPFFNAIPGVHHYANWKLAPAPSGLGWSHFDLMALQRESDLERVWFNPELDAFRRGWIAKWGYATATPTPVVAHGYVMRRLSDSGAAQQAVGRLSGGVGAPPEADLAWRVERVLHKHYALGRTKRWCWPAEEGNPLGLAWIGFDYGEGPLRIAPLAARAELLAAP
ncbi:MAG: hypothetical protein RMK90_15055 [Acetobacteraceae bacterium]|nr:hypothetical protein [Acetobacteraceae bacterium]